MAVRRTFPLPHTVPPKRNHRFHVPSCTVGPKLRTPQCPLLVSSPGGTTCLPDRLSAEYVHCFRMAERLFLFAGVGPQVGHSTFRNEDERPDGKRLIITERKRTTSRFGISAAMEVAWFVHSHIRLSVEYPHVLEYVHERDKMVRWIAWESKSQRRPSRGVTTRWEESRPGSV